MLIAGANTDKIDYGINLWVHLMVSDCSNRP